MPCYLPTPVAKFREQDHYWMEEAKVMTDALFDRYSVVGDRRTPESLVPRPETRLTPLQWFYQKLGWLLGEFFCERFDYVWKIVTDGFGAEVRSIWPIPSPVAWTRLCRRLQPSASAFDPVSHSSRTFLIRLSLSRSVRVIARRLTTRSSERRPAVALPPYPTLDFARIRRRA